MPSLPKKQKRRNYQPPRKRQPTGKQDLYQRNAWTRFSARYRTKHPLCVVCKAAGRITDVTPGGRKGATDHVIQVSDEGAQWDERNLMPLCKPCHERKSNYEQKGMLAIRHEWNENGEKVPAPGEVGKVIQKLIE